MTRESHLDGPMGRGLTVLFAIAGGSAVGNLYWAQPLLGDIGDDVQASAGATGLLVTVTQVGYALGVFFVVPLGDSVNRRKLIPTMMGLCTLALLATAFAPGFGVLIGAVAAVGVTTVAGQMLTPLAGDLADDAHRGQILGTVASGLILGILISRVVSGFVADAFGWRSVFVIAALLTFVLGTLLAWRLPSLKTRAAVPYGELLLSVLTTVRRSATVRVTMVLGAAVMSVFTIFWTGLTFLLSAGPFYFSVSQIGLVSLVAVVGALAAQRVGRLFDRGLALPTIGVGLALTLVSLVIAGVGGASLAGVVVAVGLLSVGIQSVQVLLQTRMLSLEPSARSRLNTAFVVGNFVGGAFGSTVAGMLWGVSGWSGLMVVASCLIGFALVVWAVHRAQNAKQTVNELSA